MNQILNNSFYINEESNNLEESINRYEGLFKGYINNPPTLKDALNQMYNNSKTCIAQILSEVKIHLNTKFSKIQKKFPKITFEDAQIISSYTCELHGADNNPYKLLNTNLVSNDRQSGVRKISKYLFLFLKALRKLDKYYPNSKEKYLYRGISTQVQLNYDSYDKTKIPYLNGNKKVFWAFTSASNNPKTAYDFLRKDNINNKSGTLFSLTGDVWGYDISLFNVYNEKEILLEPEREFEVEESIPPLNNVIYVRCKIKKTPLVLENIINQAMNSNNINNFDDEDDENLNINQILSSMNNKINNNIAYESCNTQPNIPKYSSSTYNNKNKKNTISHSNSQKNFLFKIQNQFNTIDNNNLSHKKKLSNAMNNNDIYNKNCLNTEPNSPKKNNFLSNSNHKNNLLNSMSQKNLLSNKKYNTNNNDKVKNNKQNSLEFTISENIIPGTKNTYYGENSITKEKVAIKKEKISNKYSYLENEKKIYELLQGVEGIPKMYWYESSGDYNYLVRELLGESLYDYFKSCDKKFPLSKILRIGKQMISLIESIHKKGIIHGYLTPLHFLFGKDSKKSPIYLVSFGNSKYYEDPITKVHIKNVGGKNFESQYSVIYGSINQLKKQANSRRDDVEAIGYILLFFLKGELPWHNVKGNSKKKEIKLNTSLDDLCRDCPEEFKSFIKYSRQLTFDDEPDYKALRFLLEKVEYKSQINAI